MNIFKCNKFSALFVILSIVISCSTNVSKNIKSTSNLVQSEQRSFKKINPSQAFEKACKKSTVISNRFLQATCDGKLSTLDLNKCLYNENGVLLYEADGEFYDSCSKCKLNYPRWNGKTQPINFECKCYDEDIREIKTNINLKDFVYFDNELKCADIDERKLGEPSEIDTKCVNPELSDSDKFVSECQNSNSGEIFVTNFQIDKCISNNNGVFDKGSHYARSCYYCTIHKEKGVHVLTCDCKDAKGSRRREYKPINNFLDFDNSEIICYDPSKKKKTEFKLDVKPSRESKAVNIPVKKGKATTKEVTIPSKQKTFIKHVIETSKIIVKKPTVKTITIPIQEAPKEEDTSGTDTDGSSGTDLDGNSGTIESGAIIDYDPELSPSDNFMRNCGQFSFDKNILTAECGTNDKLLNLDLNKCISNSNGELKFQKNGNYGGSCTGCEIISDGFGVFYLKCVCKGTKQTLRGTEEKITKLSLGEKIIITQHTKEIDCLPNLKLDEDTDKFKCEHKLIE